MKGFEFSNNFSNWIQDRGMNGLPRSLDFYGKILVRHPYSLKSGYFVLREVALRVKEEGVV